MQGHINDSLYSNNNRNVSIPYKWWHESISDYRLACIWCAVRPHVHETCVTVDKLLYAVTRVST
jgi:hypothetical protein